MTYAVMHDDVAAVGRLLDRGQDVNALDEQGCTAFEWACSYRALAVARLLVARGANLFVDVGPGTLLDRALRQGHLPPEFLDWL
jgi:ankyrin repeat protein